MQEQDVILQCHLEIKVALELDNLNGIELNVTSEDSLMQAVPEISSAPLEPGTNDVNVAEMVQSEVLFLEDNISNAVFDIRMNNILSLL